MGLGMLGDQFLWPAACAGCGKVVQVDILSSLHRCPECGGADVRLYGEVGTVGERGAVTLEEWRTLGDEPRTMRLDDGTYLCPAWGTYRLRFRDGGMHWD